MKMKKGHGDVPAKPTKPSKASKKLSVRLPVLFQHIVLDAESLEALARRAEEFASTVYTGDPAYPANIWGLARNIAGTARRCMHMLETTGEPVELMRAGYELGRYVEEVNKNLAAWAAIKQKQAEYTMRKSGADAIHAENRGCREDAERHYLEHRGKWQGNISAAARAIAGTIVPHSESTVRRWITELERRL